MKLDNYELVISFAMPCYLYIEGESKEKFYVDEQTCDYYLFNDKDAEPKFWKIMLYKPNNIKHVDKNNIHLCKWLVNESYHELVYDDSDDDTDYEYYEWDFKKHCIKKELFHRVQCKIPRLTSKTFSDTNSFHKVIYYKISKKSITLFELPN